MEWYLIVLIILGCYSTLFVIIATWLTGKKENNWLKEISFFEVIFGGLFCVLVMVVLIVVTTILSPLVIPYHIANIFK